MPASELRPGDNVTYRDVDSEEWGPWEVVEVSEEKITIRINGRLELDIEAHLLRKIEAEK